MVGGYSIHRLTEIWIIFSCRGPPSAAAKLTDDGGVLIAPRQSVELMYGISSSVKKETKKETARRKYLSGGSVSREVEISVHAEPE